MRLSSGIARFSPRSGAYEKGRPRAAFANLAGSALAELLAPARLVQADLLALDLARVARDETGLRQGWFQRRVVLDQRTRHAVAHRAGLARLAAADHVDHDVECRLVVGERQRLADDHLARFAREELVDRLVVDDELAGAALDEDPRDGALAPAGAVVVVADHCVSCLCEWMTIKRPARAASVVGERADGSDLHSISISSASRSRAAPWAACP